MRFSVRKADGSTIQMWLCVFWIVLSTLNLQKDLKRHHSYEAGFHIFGLVVFTAALALHLYFWFFGSITLSHDTIVIRQSFRPLTLPYSAIVAAQPTFTPSGKTVPHVVELEIARLSPEVYPHEYRNVYLRDSDAFLEAVRAHLHA
jgi:hypothetical protein